MTASQHKPFDVPDDLGSVPGVQISQNGLDDPPNVLDWVQVQTVSRLIMLSGLVNQNQDHPAHQEVVMGSFHSELCEKLAQALIGLF